MGNQESEEKKFTPISPKIHFQPSFELSKPIGSDVFHRHKNYGFLPLGCIHEILLYLEPPDLVSCFLSCRLVNEVGSTIVWWRSYFMYFYEDCYDEDDEEINWKSRFCERYSPVTDLFYRRFFCLVDTSKNEFRIPHFYSHRFEKARFNDRFCVLAIGSEESGKDKFMNVIANEFRVNFEDDEDGTFATFFVKRNFGKCNNPQNLNEARVTVRDFPRDSKLDQRGSLSLNPTFYGIFLCFSLYDHNSLDYALRSHQEVMKNNKDCLGSSTICFLVGILNSDDEEEEKKKVLNPLKIERIVESKKLNGYIECMIDDNIKNANVVLAFGTLLDCVIRRGNSIEKSERRKITENMGKVEGKKESSLSFHDYQKRRNQERNEEIRRRWSSRPVVSGRSDQTRENRRATHERLKQRNISTLEKMRKRWRENKKK